MKHFVIGDVHGHIRALDTLLEWIVPARGDRITFLGDYIDRGPDSQPVLDRIIDLGPIASPVAGNHERFLLAARTDPDAERAWLRYGGEATLASFGVGRVQDIPEPYFDWLAQLPWYREDSRHIFVHAGIHPARPMNLQEEEDLLWKHHPRPLSPKNGKILVCGHTPRAQPLVLANYIGLDTGIADGGVLSCLELNKGKLLQADPRGRLVFQRPVFQSLGLTA